METLVTRAATVPCIVPPHHFHDDHERGLVRIARTGIDGLDVIARDGQGATAKPEVTAQCSELAGRIGILVVVKLNVPCADVTLRPVRQPAGGDDIRVPDHDPTVVIAIWRLAYIAKRRILNVEVLVALHIERTHCRGVVPGVSGRLDQNVPAVAAYLGPARATEVLRRFINHIPNHTALHPPDDGVLQLEVGNVEVHVTVLARASLSYNVASRIANNNHLIVLDIDEFLLTEPYSTGSLIHILLRNVKHIYCTGVQFLDRPLSNHTNSCKTLTGLSQ